MNNKNPIDEKYDKFTKRLEDASNVVSTSKTVYKLLRGIGYFLLFVGLYAIIAGLIYCDKHGWEPDQKYAPPTGIAIIIAASILLSYSIKKLRNF